MLVHLDRVPLRDPSLSPEEILMSESQERMMAVVTPANIDAFLAVTAKWDVEAAVLGEVTDGEHLVVQWHGETVVDVPPRTVAHDGPVYQRPYARPESQDALQADTPDRLPRPATDEELRATLLRMVGSPNLSSRAWVTDQYDRYVMGGTALATPDDAGVVRVDEETNLGVALSLDGNGRFARLDPRTGAALSLAEAYRNVAAAGAKPLAVTDCLNFGSPEDSGVMWQFAEAVQGLALACEELGVPVTGGNVSLYNQTGDDGSELRGAADARHRCPRRPRRRPAPHPVGVAGGGAERVPARDHPRRAGRFGVGVGRARPPRGPAPGAGPAAREAAGRRPRAVLARRPRRRRARPVGRRTGAGARGVRAALRRRRAVGLDELLDRDGIDVFTALFSESAGRAIVSVPREEEVRFTDMCTARGLAHLRIGVTDAGDDTQEPALDVQGRFSVSVAELRDAHTATLPRHFG